VVQNQDTLGLMKVGDKIEFIKVVKGAENLVNGAKPKQQKAPQLEAAVAEVAEAAVVDS
jgi:hypothetical protein